MALKPVRFEYLTGIMRPIFRSARLTGGWGADGRRSEVWTTVPMEPFVAEDGCPAFRATVLIDDSELGMLPWGVSADGPAGPNVWAIPTEVSDHGSELRQLFFEPSRGEAVQRYYLTHCRRLGANKVDGSSALRFSVWAPNAQAVEVVFGDLESGYIADDGTGVLAAHPMRRDAAGVWHSEPLAGFADRTHTPYMYRITDDAGSVRYRTDLYSRSQLGSGNDDPAKVPFSGSRDDLDGAVSCSLVIDPDRVAEEFEPAVWPPTRWLDDADFWRDELDPLFPLPTRVEDLVIYELHVAGLGAGRPGPGRLGDALAFLDHLSALGVNAVELLPLAEFEGWAAWGYGTSHHFAIEFSGGGRDQLKHFVRACHQRGIAVILDVVYNHYIADAERAEWAYDSQAPERNIYYWYEGAPGDYADPTGGYVDNQSTGWAPRLWEDMVRKLFISSAAALVAEFHVDGFRVDQTTSLHSYAVRHADGRRAEHANIFGAKFLREWTRTLNLIKPGVILIAEDHSGWAAVTQPTEAGGLGFDAAWYAGFYHHLIGDAADRGPSDARLLHTAGFGDDRPLALSRFAGALQATGAKTVVYHESHDEAGNSGGSHRTLVVAANGAPLVGETRRYAEARARVVTALSVLSAGTPMFFMGEEVGALEDYRYDDFLDHREDFAALREGTGARLFRYYQDLLHLHRSRSAVRSHRLDVVGVHDANRVLAFRRDDGDEATLVIASLANHAYPSGYVISHDTLGTAWWQEVFNSDSALYGGEDVGNGGATLPSVAGAFNAVLPANGVLVFRRAP